MKALIVSDTHGMTGELAALKQRYEGQVDVMIHCGDSELQPDHPEISGFLTVEGNCDAPDAYPDERIIRIGGLSILIVHGHLLDVRRSPDRLCYRGLEVNADLVCFGHTHFAGTFQEKSMVVINPGSYRLPRNYREGTYVLFHYDEKTRKAEVDYYNAREERVAALSQSFIVNK